MDRRIVYRMGRGKKPKTLRCGWCNVKIEVKPRGRLPEFCSASCRQRAYEHSKWGRPRSIDLLTRDIGTMKFREAVRAEVRVYFKELGYEPPPPTPKKPGRDHLRLVEKAKPPK